MDRIMLNKLLMSLPDSSILTNIQVTGHARPIDVLFEKKYITTRSMENRLYSDEEVMRLPEIHPDHTHYQEWQLRKRSCRRLFRYLATRKRHRDILEIGCGNGWLSHQLATMPGTRVTGMDINFTELQQAARVFSDDPNLNFIHGDIRSGIIGERQFDYILFPASIEYFPSLKKIIYLALSYLKPEGELHILDSRLYRPAEIEIARRRTLTYYTSLGYPEMADFHFHHNVQDLRYFDHRILYNPNSFGNRLLRNKEGHPWICIKK